MNIFDKVLVVCMAIGVMGLMVFSRHNADGIERLAEEQRLMLQDQEEFAVALVALKDELKRLRSDSVHDFGVTKEALLWLYHQHLSDEL